MLIGRSMGPHSELLPGRVLLQVRPWWSVVPDLLPPQLSGPLLLPSADLPMLLVPGTPGGRGVWRLLLVSFQCARRGMEGKALSEVTPFIPRGQLRAV
ncbi:hypothetical protein E2C01_093406 [Portunus trituberculatus]|uniref:Uncharacterized protein n=1 Tax=Portunus trituberculatus TaxID=210409 RepID=A0A5B7JUP8_PORTR|nr:hypothetical protein [Portunus trituberculatus]